MIHNKKQLTQAQKGIEILSEKIKTLKDSDSVTDLLQVSAWENRIEDLRAEIEEFNSLMNKLKLEFSEDNLHKVIISLRIASGMTQKQLADTIEIQEQQIQRYEQNQYQTAGFERIIQILRVLSKKIELKVELKKEQVSNRFENVYKKYSNIEQIESIIRERQELMQAS